MDKKRLATGLLLIVSFLILGFFVGGFLGGRVFGGGGMGWDRLANALGGMMVGTVSAIAIAVLLAKRLSSKQHILVTLIVCLLIALVLFLLRIIPAPKIGDPHVPTEPTSFHMTRFPNAQSPCAGLS